MWWQKNKINSFNIGKITKEIEGHNDKVLSLELIFHPIYEKCLISQGPYFKPIKLWITKN